MAFSSAGFCPIIKLDNYEAGDVIIEGKYIGVFQGKFGNNCYKIRKANGVVEAIACGSVNFQMENVSLGSLCRFMYEGKDNITKGKFAGKSFHKVNVLVDDGLGDEVAADRTDGLPSDADIMDFE